MHIKEINIINFKRFGKFSQVFDKEMNILVGDNEAGKSSVLLGIDLVLSGSRHKVESIGLENIFNHEIINEFLTGTIKTIEQLPVLILELYFDECGNEALYGKINERGVLTEGLSLICSPNILLSKETLDALRSDPYSFPYEFYSIEFKTFSGESFSGYRKYLKHILIDQSNTSSEYAIKEYTKDIYLSHVTTHKDRATLQNEYRKSKESFVVGPLATINTTLSEYSFGVRTSPKSNLETDLIIIEDGINIEHKGKGRQCFVKTAFALNKSVHETLDVVLIEEPENHLSHLNMKKLISSIQDAKGGQLFIATHNSLISSRLDLRKLILLNANSIKSVQLKDIPNGTAEYFMKAPNHSILEYILSKKVILVEGDAEYILVEHFLKTILGSTAEENDIYIMSVGGTSFKRFLDLGRLLEIKTAVIRDNDTDYQGKCIDNYSGYRKPDKIEVFSEINNAIYTFEVALYEKNKVLCDELFGADRKTLTVQAYMLKNKTSSAIALLEDGRVQAPDYISNAIQWIRA